MSVASLPFTDFLNVVRDAPLVSIDLLIENQNGEALLGLRNNSPAAGYWFVPGGRVLKNETLDAAFERLTLAELGVRLVRSKAGVAGVYEHFYTDNAGQRPGFGTHYVVLAYHIQHSRLKPLLQLPQGEQHSRWRWQASAQAAIDPSVHPHSQAYFRAEPTAQQPSPQEPML